MDPSQCYTLDDFMAISFEQQCGPAARAAGEMAKGPGLSLQHAEKLLAKGLKGDFGPIVRWLKYIFSNSRLLLELCAKDATPAALRVLSTALAAHNADTVLWGARILTRLANELYDLKPQQLAGWFDTQGCSALLTAWRTHPDLHAIGALLPLVPPCVGLEVRRSCLPPTPPAPHILPTPPFCAAYTRTLCTSPVRTSHSHRAAPHVLHLDAPRAARRDERLHRLHPRGDAVAPRG